MLMAMVNKCERYNNCFGAICIEHGNSGKNSSGRNAFFQVDGCGQQTLGLDKFDCE